MRVVLGIFLREGWFVEIDRLFFCITSIKQVGYPESRIKLKLEAVLGNSNNGNCFMMKSYNGNRRG